jgi:uncharacterized FAD-dependent dehydrogenase
MGVRVEHPQRIIDSIQYNCGAERHELLPAAAYSLVQRVKGCGMYSFCMGPGGIFYLAFKDASILNLLFYHFQSYVLF